MSGHADTIKDALVARLWVGKYRTEPGVPAALDALDALLAENQQLREALERIAALPHHNVFIPDIAREALRSGQ